MQSLKDIQALFWNSISQPQAQPEHQQALQTVVDLERVKVYKETVITAHLNALLASFPVTASILGNTLFEGLAKGYIYFYLPTEPNLNQYGSEFPTWLTRAAQEVKDVRLIFSKLNLQTLAEFEWAMEQGYYAKDEVFSEADLQKLQYQAHQTLCFQFHPAVKIFRFKQTVSALLYGEEQDINAVNNLEQTPETLMVYRDRWQMKYQKLNQDQQQHSEWLERQLNYEAIQQEPSFHEPIIAEWIQEGIISGVAECRPNARELDKQTR